MSRARLGVRRRYRDDVRLDLRNRKIDRVGMVSCARLGVRHRYRDNVRLNSVTPRRACETTAILS